MGAKILFFLTLFIVQELVRGISGPAALLLMFSGVLMLFAATVRPYDLPEV